jgi:membrane protease YdiL (CAAX protease family)
VSAHAAGRSERAVQVAGLWGRLISATVFAAAFGGLVMLRRTVRPRHRPSTGGTVRVAVTTWLAVSPLILAINVLTGWAARQFDVTPDVHPLAVIGTNPNLTIAFLLSACVATPVVEELLVRGVFLPWAARGLTRSVVLFLPAALLSMLGSPGVRLGPLTFLGVLLLGFWALLHFGPRRAGTRARFAAVYATSVLFAAAHTSVWPTPVPLFFFSLALGAIALRTGGVGASILVHGLLNAVSATYVLRGGPM